MNDHIDIIRELSPNTVIKALEFAHMGCWEWNIQDGSEVWSDEQFRIFGHEPDEVNPSHDRFIESVHPNDRDRVLTAVENVLEGAEPYKIEFRIIRPDKTERIVISQGDVVRDNDNKSVKMIGTLFDITDHKILLDEYRRSSERFQAFMDNSTEAIYCIEFYRPVDINLTEDEQIDHFYKYSYVSEANDAWARIAGFEQAKDLIGSSLEEIMPHFIPENIAVIKEIIRSQYKLNDFESVEVYKNGVKRIGCNNIIGVIEKGHLVRFWGTGYDITKQKQLEEKLMRSEKDLQKLAGRLITNQENELRRLARELHDDLTQQLAVIAIEAGNIEQQKDVPGFVIKKVSHIKEQLIKVSKAVHNLSRDLHPSILDDLGLERAVRTECSNFSSRTGIAVVFEPRNIPDNIPIEISLAIYRIIQECLLNVRRHAKTKTAYVFLERSNGSISLSVRDTGAGFDPEEVRQKAGLGLGSMRERVRLVVGKLSITSKTGEGTNVEVEIPLKQE
jgi:PAS domain S-box-containing protein